MRRTALTLVMFLVVGCGTATTVDDPTAVVAAALEGTEAAGSALMSMTVTMEAPDMAAPMTLTVSGEIDFAAGSSRAWVESVDMGADAPGGYDEMEWIVHGGYLYMRNAMPTPPGVDGQPEWMRFSLDPDENEFGGLGGFGGPSFAGGLGSDPTELLDQLREAVEVTLVGAEGVRGETTDRYRASYRLGDLDGGWLDRLDDELDEMAASDREEYEELVTVWRDTTVITDVWVDGDELVRRIRTEVDLTDLLGVFDEEAGGSASSTVEVELFDFGVPVAIEPPDEDLVTDFSEMTAEGRSASAQVEVPAPGEVAPSPGPPPTVTAVRFLPEGFPDTFPVYDGYRPVSTQSTSNGDERYDVMLTYEAYPHPDHDDLFTELATFYDEALPALGWTVTRVQRRNDPDQAAEFDVAGHGWHGQVTITEHDPFELEVHIRIEKTPDSGGR